MNENLYLKVLNFKRKYPFTVSWRIKSHCSVIKNHLNPGEKILYAFACQKGPNSWDMFSTYVVAITNKRLILATKRVMFGYFFYSITPDMYNDLQVRMGLLWGNIIIDTVKEEIVLSNISKRALPEIETAITEFMIKEKKLYKPRKSEKK